MKEKGSPTWQAFPLCCLAALSPHIHLLPCHPRPAVMGQLIVEGIGEPKQIFSPSNLFRYLQYGGHMSPRLSLQICCSVDAHHLSQLPLVFQGTLITYQFLCALREQEKLEVQPPIIRMDIHA